MSIDSNQKTLKIGVIGLGHLHPRSYMTLFESVAGAKVVAAADASAALRDAFCNDFGVTGYATTAQLLAAQDLDIAAIFLPHADCPEAAAQCAAKGVHLMVEKPMAASAAGARAIVAAAAKAGVMLTTGYVWRLHPVAREFKALIQSGVIGQVVAAEGRCAAGRLQRYIEGGAPWMLQKARSGGGPMYNLGVHWIDLFRWMFQEEVIEVCGRNVKVNTQYDIEDNSFAHLRFANGAIAALDISYTVPDAFPYGRDLYLSVRGTQGVVTWAPAFEGQRDTLLICSDHPSFNGSPRVTREYELQPTPGYCGFMGASYVRQFVDCVRRNQTPPITGDDGVAALQIVEAIYQSDASKQWVAVR
ncbi:MAG: Gfo/Idh/MocA family oxidoreductase [Phycisphaeraceae bacterium]